MPHPVLIYIYGGPGSQVVLNQWMWAGEQGQFYRDLIGKHNFIIARIDGTGTAGRSRDYVTKVYRDLGHFESDDLIYAIDYLRDLPYVDSTNVSLWGWSYGGYLTAFTAAKAGDRLKTAISVAPVTSWRYYDTIYTERFMSLPRFNATGYLESSLLPTWKDYQQDSCSYTEVVTTMCIFKTVNCWQKNFSNWTKTFYTPSIQAERTVFVRVKTIASIFTGLWKIS